MEIIQQLRDLDGYTASEQEIIRVIFQDPDFLKTATAQELAKAAYTSASTVVRLCQKLGCKTYHEFQVRFAAEQERWQMGKIFADANLPFNRDDTPEMILRRLTDLQSVALRETHSLVDMKRYRHAVEMLAAADSIDIYGISINLHLAYDFAYKMARIQRNVQITLDSQQSLLTAVTPYPNHCAIVISYSGETAEMVQYAELLRKSKTPFVSITSTGDNSVARRADERLYIATMEKRFSKLGAFASYISIATVMNYLYAGIFSLDYDKNYQLLLSTALRFADFRFPPGIS